MSSLMHGVVRAAVECRVRQDVWNRILLLLLKLILIMTFMPVAVLCHVTSPSSLRDGRQCADGLVPTNALCLVWCVADSHPTGQPTLWCCQCRISLAFHGLSLLPHPASCIYVLCVRSLFYCTLLIIYSKRLVTWLYEHTVWVKNNQDTLILP